jgi:hypothetical protein
MDNHPHHPLADAINNGDCPCSLHKLISPPELSKHLTTSHCPFHDAINNGDCPILSEKLISAPELSKHLTTSHLPSPDAINNGGKDNVMLLNVYLVLVEKSICVKKMDNHHCL